MTEQTLGGKVEFDTTDFKTGIVQMNRQVRVIESGFQAAAASIGKWSDNVDGLELRNEALTKKLEINKLQVEATRKEYERIAEEQGESSSAAQNMAVKLNNLTKQLNNNERFLNENEDAIKEMREEQEQQEKQTEKSTRATQKFSSILNRLGRTVRNVTGGLGKMARTAATAAKSIGRSIGAIARSIGRLTKRFAILGAAAAAALGALIFSTIEPASDLVETANKINEIFGDAAGTINEFADSAAIALGQSKQEALDAAANFGIFGSSAGLSGDELSDFSTRLVGLASDLASFNNTSPEEAIEAIGSALRGEAEPIRKYGVLMNEATLRQVAFEEGITKTTKEALTPQQKVLAAYALIIKQTEVAQGDFAKTSGGLANQQRILTAWFKNTQATLGTGLLPSLELGAQKLTEFLANPKVNQGVESISKGLGQMAESLVNLFSGDKERALDNLTLGLANIASIGGADIGDVHRFVSGITDAISNLTGAFQEGFEKGGIAGGLASLVAEIISGILESRLQFVELAIDLIEGLVDGLLSAIPTLLPVAIRIINRLVEFITQTLPVVASAAVEIILALINGILPELPKLVEAALDIIITLADGLSDALPKLIPIVTEVVLLIVATLIENLPLVIDAALELILALVEGLVLALPILTQYTPEIVEAFVDALIIALPLIAAAAVEMVVALVEGIAGEQPQVRTAADDIINNIGKVFTETLPELWEMGKQIVEGIWKGIQKQAANFKANIQKFFSNIVANVKDALGIESPSRVFARIGSDMVRGLSGGFQSQFSTAERDIRRSISGLGGIGATLGVPALSVGSGSGSAAIAAPVNVTIHATITNDTDPYILAQRVVEEIERRR